MRDLITGGTGFAGRHLARHLIDCGDDVAVTYLPLQPLESSAEHEEKGIPVPKAAQSLALDVTDRKAVNEVVALLKPDVIYHLAGITFVPEGENDIDHTFEVNFRGTINVLEAVAKYSRKTRVLVVSSAEVYGDPRPGSLPFTELSELRPISNYGLSKAAADLAAFKYHRREKVDVVRVRPFPHVGPGQNESFAVSSFAHQIACIKLGRKEPVIQVGNLEAKRDYTDVSDIVRGYREASLNGKAGEVYNLCYGESISMGDVLASLIKIADVDAKIVTDPSRVRPVDIPDLYGSHARAQRDFGWRPRVEREVTFDTILSYWLEYLS